MGKRARRGGIANVALRAARVAAQQQDDELARIAEHVYAIGREVKAAGGVKLPLAVYAPFRAAAELAALGVTRAYGLAERLGVSRERAQEAVADYLVAWLVEMVSTFNVEHFVNWWERLSALEAGNGDANGSRDGASAPQRAGAGNGGADSSGGSAVAGPDGEDRAGGGAPAP